MKIMKGIFIFNLLLLSVLIVSCHNGSQVDIVEEQQSGLVFPKGEKITISNFAGAAWLNSLIAPDSTNQNAVGSITFEAGARTNWHSNPSGQIILAIKGEGYYQERGLSKEILHKGDVKKCPPNIPHWHGASASSEFIQIAITGRENGATVWLEPVTDEEYAQEVR